MRKWGIGPQAVPPKPVIVNAQGRPLFGSTAPAPSKTSHYAGKAKDAVMGWTAKAAEKVLEKARRK